MKTTRNKKTASNRKSGGQNSESIFKGGILKLVFRVIKLLFIFFIGSSIFFVVFVSRRKPAGNFPDDPAWF